MAKALIFFSPGMVFVSATTLLTRAFYGIQKTWVPLVVGLVNLALNAVLDLVFYKPLGVGGITLSTSLVSAFYFFALLILLSREIGGVRAGEILRSGARALVALVPLVLVGYASWWAVQHALDPSEYPSNQSQIAAIVCGVCAGRGVPTSGRPGCCAWTNRGNCSRCCVAGGAREMPGRCSSGRGARRPTGLKERPTAGGALQSVST